MSPSSPLSKKARRLDEAFPKEQVRAHSTWDGDFAETTGSKSTMVEIASGPWRELSKSPRGGVEYGLNMTLDTESPSFVSDYGATRLLYIG